MGLLTGLLSLPFAPIRGTVWVAETVQQQAEQQYYDPATIQRELELIDDLRSQGAIDEAEATAREDELVQRLMDGRSRQHHTEG